MSLAMRPLRADEEEEKMLTYLCRSWMPFCLFVAACMAVFTLALLVTAPAHAQRGPGTSGKVVPLTITPTLTLSLTYTPTSTAVVTSTATSATSVTPTPTTPFTPSPTPPPPSPTCPPVWSTASSPNLPDLADNSLTGIDALSANNIWAAGAANGGSLIEHWDGSAWSISPSPAISQAFFTSLSAVSAVNANDVWAVGKCGYCAGNAQNLTLMEHWNGSAWSIVPSPDVPNASNDLTAVAALAGNDVWAVGDSADSSAQMTLVEHWNGSAWSIVPSPDVPGAYNYLTALAAVAGDDVWAVGYSSSVGPEQILVEHWNGSAWSIVPSPNVPGVFSYLTGVAAVDGNDVWAVGYASDPSTGVALTLVEHWNGSAWSIVPSQSPRNEGLSLTGVSAVAANDVWTVGYYNAPGDLYRTTTLLEHWDGRHWNIVPSPNDGSSRTLNAVVGVAGNDVWAVGGGTNGTLTERWDGSTMVVVPSANPPFHSDFLSGVAALSTTDVWAVGDYGNGTHTLTLTEHWDGSHWSMCGVSCQA